MKLCREHIVPPGRAALQTTASSKPWGGLDPSPHVVCNMREACSQIPSLRMQIFSLKMDSDEVKNK